MIMLQNIEDDIKSERFNLKITINMSGLFFKKFIYLFIGKCKNTDTVIIWTFRKNNLNYISLKKSIMNNLNLIHYSIIIMMRETKA